MGSLTCLAEPTPTADVATSSAPPLEAEPADDSEVDPDAEPLEDPAAGVGPGVESPEPAASPALLPLRDDGGDAEQHQHADRGRAAEQHTAGAILADAAAGAARPRRASRRG